MTVETGQAALDAAGECFLDLFTPEGRADPYARYARMRELAPVFMFDNQCVLTRYEDCDRVLRDAGAFPVGDPAWMDSMWGDGWRDSPALSCFADSMLNQNAPEHTRQRKLISATFTPRRVRDLAGRVGELVDERLNAMADAGSDGGAVDAHASLALALPLAVIAALIGIPEPDVPWVNARTAAFSCILDLTHTEEELDRADTAILELYPYLEDLAAQRRRAPRDDLLSALAATSDDAATHLADAELSRMMAILFLAGYETTVNLIGNGVVALLAHPDQARALRADPARAEAIVEEVLRYDAPVQVTTDRHAYADTVIGDTLVPAGMEVAAFVGAANRDPARFPDPDRFDPDRRDTKVLSFGIGPHYCLGAHLARLEATVAFRELFTRFPHLALAAEPTRRSSFNLHGYASIPVTVTPSAR